MKIQIYGDSILKGVVLNEETNRYCITDNIGFDNIAEDINAQYKNYSRFGCTIDKGIGILKNNLEKGEIGDYALIEYGGNDSDFAWSEISNEPLGEHCPKTPIEKFKEQYKKLISLLMEKGIKPILATLPPVDAEKYLNWICRDGLSEKNILKWLGDVGHIYRYQEQYSKAVEEIAEETGCEIIDLRSEFIKHGNLKELFCNDGIHPNENGQRIIHGVIVNFINKVRAQKSRLGLINEKNQ